MGDFLGLLKIRVKRGINLAIRDVSKLASSDPYVTISCGSLKVKSKVVKNNRNPIWGDELTLYVKDLTSPIVLSVYDKDTFTEDDNMGSAHIKIKPLTELGKTGSKTLPDGTIIDRIQPSDENDLANESCIVWSNGKMVQDMILKLKNVETGEIEVQVEWVDVPVSDILG